MVGPKGRIAGTGGHRRARTWPCWRNWPWKFETKSVDIPGLRDVAVDLKKYGEETRVVLDRERAAAFGLTIKEIGENLKIAIQGEVATQYRKPERDVDIRVKMWPPNYQTRPDFNSLFIHSRELHADIPLQSVAHMETGPGLREIYRSDQVRVIPIRGNAVGRRLSACQEDIDQVLAGMTLPEEYHLVHGGEAAQNFPILQFLDLCPGFVHHFGLHAPGRSV